MEHKAQLENIKYRNWVRAGLGIKYVKEGLEPFCDHLVNQQYIAIIKEVKRKHNLSAVSCGLCDIRTLQPDHVQTKTRQCPLGQTNCNCLRPGGKASCPSNVCGSIYDEIIKRHAYTPPAPYWRNTDSHQWCTEPWAVAKCFINAPGYEHKKSVVEFDCSGLLHLLINNTEFHEHIQCQISGNDAFSRVLRHRNAIFHSDNMELDDTEFITCLNDMIELLQDEKEIKEREEPKQAVKKLLELKQEKFIITTTDETEIRNAMAAVAEKEKNLEQKIVDAKNEIKVATDESEQQIKNTGSAFIDALAQKGVDMKEHLKKTGLDLKERLEQRENEIKEALRKREIDSSEKLDQKQTEIKENLRMTEVDSKRRLNQKETDIKENLRMTEGDSKRRLNQKEKEIKENLMMTEGDSKRRLNQKETEIKENLRMTEGDSKKRLNRKENEIKENLRMTEVDLKRRLNRKETEIKENLRMTEGDSRRRLNQKETEIKVNLRMTEVHSKRRLNQKETEVKENLKMTEEKAKDILDQKGKEIKEDLERKGKHLLYQLDLKQSAPVHIEPRHSKDISKEAAGDLTNFGLRDMPLPPDTERKRAVGSVNVIEKTPTFIQRLFRGIYMPREMKGGSENVFKKTLNFMQSYLGGINLPSKKEDFQAKLVKRYEDCFTDVSPVPLKPHRKQGNVSDVYVPPWMTVKIKNEESKIRKEVQISMHEIFRNKEKPAKNIYVIGDAGTGKSMLSKMLVHCWCIAHSHQENSLDKSYIMIVKEIKRYEFLFYVSLRRNSDCDSIEKMLEKSYRDPALGDILQNDSCKCLIVLDGLDEWKPERKYDFQFITTGLPGRDLDADYTIITTTRQWKFDDLKISDSEVDKKIKLRGIDICQMKCFTEKTVKMLNDIFQQSKNAEKCRTDLQSRRFSDICHIPLMLQQLICLWFDDRLRENSKYAIYSNMLVFFFEWNALKMTSKHQEYEIVTQARMHDLPLPDYLCHFKVLRENIRVIQYLSQLAYETLFDKNKEANLTFSNSALERMNIPNDVIRYCLNIGILTEEQDISLPASTSQQSIFSFFHKSVQEYLAGVYVAIQLKEMLKSRKLFPKDNEDLADVCKTSLRKYFGSCKKVVDILDQLDMLIMLCGLEPQLLTNVSKYIYDVTLVDKLVVEERYTLPEHTFSSNHHNLIKDIQTGIFMCIEEVLSSSAKNAHIPVYIADIHVSRSNDLLRYCICVVSKNVLSIEIDEWCFRKTETDTVYLIMKHLGKCNQLKAIKFSNSYGRINNEVTKILDTNVFTLETVSFLYTNKKIIKHLVSILPKMQRLTSLQMTISCVDRIPHDVCLSLCTYLNQTTNLKHAVLTFNCEECDDHMIDLSKHNQLQHVEFIASTFSMVSCNTDNLETCKLSIKSIDMMKQVFTILCKADKLKHLFLSDETKCRTPTKNLIRLLSSLVSLSTLTLCKFIFTNNIIARPCDMRNLKKITLHLITMSLTTWCKFVDGLPALPQVVKVETSFMLYRDSIFKYSMSVKNPEEDAQQYVREKTNLFRVTYDEHHRFHLITKKGWHCKCYMKKRTT